MTAMSLLRFTVLSTQHLSLLCYLSSAIKSPNWEKG